jgi:hypothetical protein
MDVKHYFKNEEYGFGNWLIKNENLQTLSDEIGINLSNPKKEAKMGNYYCDMICDDVYKDRKVIIESQLTKADHEHLGKLLTYAGVCNCLTLVWLCSGADDEHIMAIRHICANSSLEIYLVKIGIITTSNDSVVTLNCIEKPLKTGSPREKIEADKRTFEHISERKDILQEILRIFDDRKIFVGKVLIAEGLVNIEVNSKVMHLTIAPSIRYNRVGINLFILYKEGISEKLKAIIEINTQIINQAIDGKIYVNDYVKTKSCYIGFMFSAPNINDPKNYKEYGDRAIDLLCKFHTILKQLGVIPTSSNISNE